MPLEKFQIDARIGLMNSKPPNLAEIALRAYEYLKYYPDAKQIEIALYLRLKKPETTGVANVSRALKFLREADMDLFDGVLHGKTSYHAAIREMKKRRKDYLSRV
ncbi:hypothetical protein HF888_16490 (plasmid) [Bermanella marisrubri]|uniref:Uncharacterized protein n=1 Tax=Bermanella marisrubri TaxID=207949 RepID=Q1MY07_9GAMM|nr:hypothetical protein [Bermanella marisrubri]EAT10889.1 hypothetical protein RED65_02083 [Oceanobacter sp. RED65] [Bermanella marisrubri]QIZ85939.1 hypothetical protein HF888_16490 [Bermanella marisrubri]